MKDRSRREENKEECSEGSPLGKLNGAYSQENRGQFFLKIPSVIPFSPTAINFPCLTVTSSSSSPPVCSLQGSSAINVAIIILSFFISGSLLGSDSGPVHSGLSFWVSSSTISGLFWVFRVSLSPLRHFEFQPLSPSVLCSPSIVLLLFFFTYSVLYSLFVCDCDLNFMPKFTYLTF